MSSTESAASSSVASNFSTTPARAPSWWEDNDIDNDIDIDIGCPNADAVRRALRGMESELVDLVLNSSCAGGWMDWLRVPLECATTTGRLDAVKRLLAAGVETSIPPRRSSPGPLLHAAAANGNAGVVCELLKAGADVHEVDKTRSDRTALHSAAGSGAEDAVLALVRAGAKVEAPDARGWTPLHVAAKLGHRGVVVFLLLKGAHTLRTTLPEGDTALHLAASGNHAGVIEDLVVLGDACVSCPNVNGQTALHIAARGCHLEACIALLRAGSAVGRVSSQGLSCLDIAAWNGHTGRLLQILTAAEPTADRKRRCSLALYYATKANKPSTIHDLVELGANVDQRKSGGMTNLHLAAARGTDGATEALLRAGASLEARSHGGDTPLHRACSFSQRNTVRLLLRCGALETIRNFGNQTPFDVVGTASANTEAVVVAAAAATEEFEDKLVRDDAIRQMLESAPADRVWRRRSWLVLCRARWLARIMDNKPREAPPRKKPAPIPFPSLSPSSSEKRPDKNAAAVVLAVHPSKRPREVDKSKAKRRRTKGGVGAVLRLGRDSVLSDILLREGALSDGEAGLRSIKEGAGNARFLRAVERLLLLREEGVFREVVAYL